MSINLGLNLKDIRISSYWKPNIIYNQLSLYNIYIYILEVNSQTKYEFYIFIETLQIVSSMCSLQMSMYKSIWKQFYPTYSEQNLMIYTLISSLVKTILNSKEIS
jgi:hypothetical protein